MDVAGYYGRFPDYDSQDDPWTFWKHITNILNPLFSLVVGLGMLWLFIAQHRNYVESKINKSEAFLTTVNECLNGDNYVREADALSSNYELASGTNYSILE